MTLIRVGTSVDHMSRLTKGQLIKVKILYVKYGNINNDSLLYTTIGSKTEKQINKYSVKKVLNPV